MLVTIKNGTACFKFGSVIERFIFQKLIRFHPALADILPDVATIVI
jgi:hypothetical protein